MRTKAGLTLLIMLGIGLAGPGLTAAAAAATWHSPHRAWSSHRHGARALHRPRFRPSRGASARDAAQLGALVGKQCHGKASMPRNDHESVVLCSNGKTFVVEAPHEVGAAATECSLAGSGPQPPCFDQ